MHWKFWEKNKTGLAVKLSKPKELPSRVGRNMVVDLKYDPDWVWQLKMVDIKKENSRNEFDFRIFDPVTALQRGIKILNFNSLDDHPELIYFDGRFDKETWEIQINDRYKTFKRDSAA
jgi:hypothetical protein